MMSLDFLLLLKGFSIRSDIVHQEKQTYATEKEDVIVELAYVVSGFS